MSQRLTIEEKKLRGTLRKSREKGYSQKDKDAKIRESGALYPDKSFIKEERVKFDELASALENNPTIGASDSFALQNLARLIVELRAVEKYLKKNGHTYTFINREGKPVPKRRPESTLRQELIIDTTRLFIEFGLSPRARGAHKSLETKKVPDFDCFPGEGKEQ